MSDKKSGFNPLWIIAAIVVLLIIGKFKDPQPTFDFYEVSQSSRKASSIAIENEELRRSRNNEEPLTNEEITEITDPITIREVKKSREINRIKEGL